MPFQASSLTDDLELVLLLIFDFWGLGEQGMDHAAVISSHALGLRGKRKAVLFGFCA